jgi:hypothetical protein
MEFQLDRTIDILRSTPATLRALLGELQESLVTSNEGPDTFSPFDVVGHLLHGERTDWIPRLTIILEHGASRPFEPFDRFAQLEESKGKSLHELLDAFEELRARNVETLEGLDLQPDQLDLEGTHPALGTVTARQLISTWAVHDLGHIAQIVRVIARVYSEQAGPWASYLRVLRD